MIRSRRVGWTVLVLVLAASGCAAFVARDDYADYRAVRVARDDEARLLAMQAYVARHPNGEWADEVQNERRLRDVGVYERGKGDRRGIELYLRAFPDGAFAAQARARLQAIEDIEARKALERERALRLASERRARDEELRRTWVNRFVGYWVRTLLRLERWGTPIEEAARANPAFSRAFGQVPRPRCTTDECVKVYEDRFAVPVPGGTRMERSLKLLLRLTLRSGRLERAELLLPAWGFSRWFELEERRAVVDAIASERAAAVERARLRAEPLLASVPGTWTPIADAVLPPPPTPTITATTEQTDTTAEDPGAPSDRIGSGRAEADEAPTVRERVQPGAADATPDMVLDPLHVRRDGRLDAAGAAGSGDGSMVFEPMAVPREGGSSAGSAMSASPRSVVAWRNGSLRLSIFAAATDEGEPAYDGIAIEHVAPDAPAAAAAR